MNVYARLFSEIAEHYPAVDRVKSELWLDERMPQAAYKAAETACIALNALMTELDRLNKATIARARED